MAHGLLVMSRNANGEFAMKYRMLIAAAIVGLFAGMGSSQAGYVPACHPDEGCTSGEPFSLEVKDFTKITKDDPYTYTFDLTGLYDTIYEAILSIVLWDDRDKREYQENVSLYVDGGFRDHIGSVNNGAHDYDYAVTANLVDKLLTFTLKNSQGWSDVWFKSATLEGCADPVYTPDPNSSVPEPTSLALFGLGLVTLGWRTRRRRSA